MVAPATRPATIEELYHVPENGKAELIHGAIQPMSPTGRRPNRASAKIWLRLYEYEQATGKGIAAADNAGFRVSLSNRESFSPDAAFYVGEDPGMSFFEGAPAFDAEVRSEGDYGRTAEREMADRRADYFAAGTQVVWDVDLLSEHVVKVYRASEPEKPVVYRRGEEAEAEPAVPGWRMSVDDLFA